jgi:CheY-like chemotaxis protein
MALIFVVEDEPAIAEVLRDLLEMEGYAVATAGDGHAALRRLGEVRPALVLSDLMMPRLDGWGLCRALQADARYQAIPVVLMSAGAAPDGADGCAYAAFLSKPFEVDTLLTTIRRVAGGPANA